MSTYSKNLFDVLGDGEVPRPAPVKEEETPVVDKKNVSKINKDAARAARTQKNGGKRQPKDGKQRGRQFDRHSGTGIVDSQKKINQGWGKAGASEAEAAKDTLNPADPDAAEQEAAAPVQEEEKVKTLDEYLAEKAGKSLNVALPEARKANDADESAFKGAVAFEKEQLQEFYVSKDSKASKKPTEKARKEKVFVDIEQRFAEKPREFRDRRGNARGGNKKRGNNNKNSAAPAVNLQDASAFPTLGATA